MIRAVKQLTGLPIHHLIVIKFTGFPKMVDALGGVTVTNPTALVNCPYEAGRTVSFAAGQIGSTAPRRWSSPACASATRTSTGPSASRRSWRG